VERGIFKDEYNLQALSKVELKQGFQMYITPRYHTHYVKNEYEPFSSEIVRKYLKEASTFVDVGAHYGYYSLLAGNRFGAGKIIAIEAVKETYEILKKNIELNGIQGAELYNFAASDKKETKIFNVTEASDSCGFYEHPLTDTKGTFEVEALPLDDVLSSRKVDFIKIDVEGHEIPVLAGLIRTIKNNDDLVMLVELTPELQKNAGYRPVDLLEKLDELGFDCFIVDEKKRKTYRWQENIFPLWILLGFEKYVNILCLKKEKSLSVVYFGHNSSLLGAERCLLELVEGMEERGALSHIIMPKNGPFIRKIREGAVSFSIIYYGWWVYSRLYAMAARTALYLFHKIMSLYVVGMANPHVVYTNTMVISEGAYTAFMLNKPHLWYIHEFGEKDHRLRFLFTLKGTQQIINLFSDKIVYNSRAVKKEFKGNVAEDKSSVIYCDVKLPEGRMGEPPEESYRSKDSLKLILLGNVTESKGQDQAVKAVTGLIKAGEKVELLILGVVSHKSRYFTLLKKEVEDSGVEGVYFREFTENPYPYIMKADVLLMCSSCEAFGRVTVEAMRLKKPVIGADTGGTLEVIKDGFNGVLYENGNVDDLKKKIRLFINNRDKISEMGANGYRFSAENFSEKKYIDPVFDLLVGLKSKKRLFYEQIRRLTYLMKILFGLVFGRSS